MRKTQLKMEPPRFDEEGYQINMTSLNGEPLPDVSEWKSPTRHQVQGFPLSDSVQYDRVESGGIVTLSPRPKGGARVGAGRKPAGKLPLVVRLSPEIIAKVRARSKQEGVTISEVVARRLARV